MLKNQRGIAYVEMLPLLVLFVLMFGLSFGLWTSIHRATLKSIAARHYSFEVLNNRTHYIYHKDTREASSSRDYYAKNGMRFFANVAYQESESPELQRETKNNSLSLFDDGITQIHSPKASNSSDFPDEQTNPIKAEIGYGICIDTKTCDL